MPLEPPSSPGSPRAPDTGQTKIMTPGDPDTSQTKIMTRGDPDTGQSMLSPGDL